VDAPKCFIAEIASNENEGLSCGGTTYSIVTWHSVVKAITTVIALSGSSFRNYPTKDKAPPIPST
jgi:hypothetical protein